MTSIQQQMKEAIEANTYTSTAGLSVEGLNQAAAKCADVAMEAMVDFYIYMNNESWQWSKTYSSWYRYNPSTGTMERVNTKELIKVYLSEQKEVQGE